MERYAKLSSPPKMKISNDRFYLEEFLPDSATGNSQYVLLSVNQLVQSGERVFVSVHGQESDYVSTTNRTCNVNVAANDPVERFENSNCSENGCLEILFSYFISVESETLPRKHFSNVRVETTIERNILTVNYLRTITELFIVDYQFSKTFLTFGFECFKLIVHNRSLINYHVKNFPNFRQNVNVQVTVHARRFHLAWLSNLYKITRNTEIGPCPQQSNKQLDIGIEILLQHSPRVTIIYFARRSQTNREWCLQ